MILHICRPTTSARLKSCAGRRARCSDRTRLQVSSRCSRLAEQRRPKPNIHLRRKLRNPETVHSAPRRLEETGLVEYVRPARYRQYPTEQRLPERRLLREFWIRTRFQADVPRHSFPRFFKNRHAWRQRAGLYIIWSERSCRKPRARRGRDV